jgi:hypothetical protein
MSEFIKIPASSGSLKRRKLSQGRGINDAWYAVKPVINGERMYCPAYKAWSGMMTRCYSEKWHKKWPSYIGCSVCDEWLIFSNFAKWFDLNHKKGYDLDKDLREPGNKVYGPDTCLCVPKNINYLILGCDKVRGDYPIGVCWNKKSGKFIAQLRAGKSRVHLGYFSNCEDAFKAYKLGKNKEILRKCNEYPEFSVYLKRHLYEVNLDG